MKKKTMKDKTIGIIFTKKQTNKQKIIKKQ